MITRCSVSKKPRAVQIGLIVENNAQRLQVKGDVLYCLGNQDDGFADSVGSPAPGLNWTLVCVR